MSSNKIFFKLWNPTGMINQVMSMEIAVGLSHLTKKQLIVHYLSNNGDNLYDFKKVPIYTPSRWYNPQRQDLINENQFPHITDILSWDEDMILIDQNIPSFPQENNVIDSVAPSFYYSPESGEMSKNEIDFADGRTRINLEGDVHLQNTLAWYSRFFYNRTPELDLALSKVKFKQEYYDFAQMIVNQLGKFQGGHLRLSDHMKMFTTTQEMFEAGLYKLEQNNLPIVISTCEPSHKMVIENRHRFILLDEFIVNNFSNEFKNLKFTDEVIFGLICNLVMHHSEHFIGTSGSTYTGYIQRLRANSGKNETWNFWDQPNYNSNGDYSWNTELLPGGQKNWWREWPESKFHF